jgi:hypothetical protein
MFHYLLQDSGGELAEVKGGIQECLIQGLNTGTLDLQVNGWGHKVKLLSLTSPPPPHTHTQKKKNHILGSMNVIVWDLIASTLCFK